MRKPQHYSELLGVLKQKDCVEVGMVITSSMVDLLLENRCLYLKGDEIKLYMRKEESRLFNALDRLVTGYPSRMTQDTMKKALEHANTFVAQKIMRIDLVTDAIVFMYKRSEPSGFEEDLCHNLNDCLFLAAESGLQTRMLEYRDYVNRLSNRLSRQYSVRFQN